MSRSQLARWGITHQVFKSALAASASYAIAATLVDHKFPFFAPMAALLTIQVTIFNSYSRGLQRILAIILGVGVALMAFHFTGANWWIIFIITFVTLMIGTRLGLGIAAINQVPMSALLILATKAFVPMYAFYRIVDTILGTLVAVLVNLLLWPPDNLPKAEQAVDDLAGQIVGLLKDVAHAVRREQAVDPQDLMRRARQLDKQVGKTLTTITTAQQSLKFNPRVKRLSPITERYRTLIGTLERVGVQTRGIAKSVTELLPQQESLPNADQLARLLETASDQVRFFVRSRVDGDDLAKTRALDAFGRSRELYQTLAENALGAFHQPYRDSWTRYGGILADVSHMLKELADQLEAGSTGQAAQ